MRRPRMPWVRRGSWWPVRVILLAAAIGGAALLSQQQAGGTLAGPATVVDGDTLHFGGVRARLDGLDAPELDQTCTDAGGRDWPCGEAARAFLKNTVRDAELTCDRLGSDRYGRALVRCAIAGEDLGEQIVAAGWAIGPLRYGAAENAARTARRGIWAGSFTAPADWRRDEPSGGFWGWLRNWFG